MKKLRFFLSIAIMSTSFLYSEAIPKTKSHFTQYKAYTRNPVIPKDVWNDVTPYLLPEDHPIKPILDKIFKKSRAIKDEKSLHDAGFKNTKKLTNITVITHPNIPGYVIKTYLDSQTCLSESDLFIKRIQGANLIHAYIHQRGWGGKFKVPKKWIYPLPEHPAPPSNVERKHFILIAEDMDILSEDKNIKKWGGSKVTTDLLEKIFAIIKELGLRDCATPDSIPFSHDGKIAFVDTQIFNKTPVNFQKFLPFLNQENRIYWQYLIDKKGAY